ncbi:MAG: tetratricopeptide repeat protein [Bdellovibrionales bacterium]|nr:tetratricopeptide repeat protein [Bdellovibrionales bacterium]
MLWILLILLFTLRTYGNPLSFPAHKGVNDYEHQKYDNALQALLDAHMNDPENAVLKYNIGNTYYKLGQYDKAKEWFDAASKTDDANLSEQSIYNRGNAFYKMNQVEEAAKSYEKVLELNPKDEDAKHNLALARQKMREQKQNKEQSDQNSSKEEPSSKNKDQSNSQESSPSQQEKDSTHNLSQQGKDKQPQSQDAKKEGSTENKDQSLDQSSRKSDERTLGQSSSTSNEEKNSPQPVQMNESKENTMTEEEANRWLSTVHDARKNYYQKRAKSQNQEPLKEDW